MKQLSLFGESHKEVTSSGDTKVCVGCEKEKPLKEFKLIDSHYPNRKNPTCRVCDSKAYLVKEIWKKNNPLPEDYACPICGMTHKDYLKLGKYKTQSPFSVDHCQKNMKVRGWICNPCNSSLGLAKHDVDVLRKMIAYLNCGP